MHAFPFWHLNHFHVFVIEGYLKKSFVLLAVSSDSALPYKTSGYVQRTLPFYCRRSLRKWTVWNILRESACGAFTRHNFKLLVVVARNAPEAKLWQGKKKPVGSWRSNGPCALLNTRLIRSIAIGYDPILRHQYVKRLPSESRPQENWIALYAH